MIVLSFMAAHRASVGLRVDRRHRHGARCNRGQQRAFAAVNRQPAFTSNSFPPMAWLDLYSAMRRVVDRPFADTAGNGTFSNHRAAHSVAFAWQSRPLLKN